MARHTYIGIGELTKKTLGCGIQNIEYQYQMRGWLTQLNDPADLNKGFAPADKHFFGMKLAYDGVGNITTWDYRNAQTSYGPPYDLIQQAPYQYGFTYDKLNRLTSGTLAQQGQTKFTLGKLSYDENGNIQTMTRSMNNASDVMGYTYGSNSNKLTSLSSSQGLNLAKSTTYSYDQAGNLLTDQTKGITSIGYNYLNLPATITKGGQPITYTYSASGQKLKADFGGGKVYDYVGGLVYANNQLEFIPTAEGRVLPPGLASTTVATGSSTSVIASNRFYRYEYHLKDHLGNLRVACRCGERQTETSPGDSYEPLVVQEQHYDPFGLDLTGLNSQMGVTASRFKYNGKEEQQGLVWIDYGARMYDPAVGRWLSIDPHAEKYESISPYSYGFDNPIRYVDLQGKDPGDVAVIFGGANLRPWENPYGISSNIVKRLQNEYFNSAGGKVQNFVSNYFSVDGGSVGHVSGYGYRVKMTQDLDNLTQEAYEYVKNNLQKDGRLVIYGYSWGGVLANHLSKRLEKDGIDISSMILVDAANGSKSDEVDRTISRNVKEITNIYQENEDLPIFSRGFAATKLSQSTQGHNVRVNIIRDKNGQFQASHTNIDDATLNQAVNELIRILNSPKK